MKLVLLTKIGDMGILLDYKPVLPDVMEIEIQEEGSLIIGAKSYPVINGKVRILDYQITPGPNKVVFAGQNNVNYFCGVIHRNGRFINVVNPVENIVVSLALAYQEQGEEIDELKKEHKKFKEQYGISII